MGYTHYWTRKQAEIPLDKWLTFVERLVPILKEHAGLIEDLKIDHDVVFFNGACETFVLERNEAPKSYGDGGWFSFCKTRQDEYDKLVVAALILCASALKGDPVGFTWSSDGGPGDHAEGLALTGLRVRDAVLAGK